MSRKPYRVTTSSFFRVKVKNVKKYDNIVVGGREMRVRSNRKNDFGNFVLTCSTFDDQSPTTLIFPKNVKVGVNRRETSFPKK